MSPWEVVACIGFSLVSLFLILEMLRCIQRFVNLVIACYAHKTS